MSKHEQTQNMPFLFALQYKKQQGQEICSATAEQ